MSPNLPTSLLPGPHLPSKCWSPTLCPPAKDFRPQLCSLLLY